MLKLISVDGKFIHAVDFGNHLKSKNPFMEIYNLSPEKFKRVTSDLGIGQSAKGKDIIYEDPDTGKVHASKMIKKLLNTLIQPKVSTCIDAKSWIQKILLEKKYGKINS